MDDAVKDVGYFMDEMVLGAIETGGQTERRIESASSLTHVRTKVPCL